MKIDVCQVQSSEIGDDRPITACAFSPGGQQLATAALSGLLKLWTVPDCQKIITIKAHADRVTGEMLPALTAFPVLRSSGFCCMLEGHFDALQVRLCAFLVHCCKQRGPTRQGQHPILMSLA